MKHYFLVILIFISFFLISQTNFRQKDYQQIDIDTVSETATILPMRYGKFYFTSLPELKNLLVTKIVLVYTKSRLVPDFNQKQLNKQRWQQLFVQFPQLVSSNNIWKKEQWQQTEPIRANAMTLFHGFIVYYKQPFSDIQRQNEINWVEQQLKRLTGNQENAILSLNDSVVAENYELKKKRKFELKQRWDDKIGFVHDTVWLDEYDRMGKYVITTNVKIKVAKDSVINKAFDKLDESKRYLIVMDATGSMGKYIISSLEWIFSHNGKLNIEGVVFFNDGNNKKSKKKRPLKTGGIYWCENDSVQIAKTVMKCMKNGSGGGEFQENDIEAIVKGLEQFNNVDEVVLIADNKEWMRDINYWYKINVPVNVILCDTKHRSLNTEYLNLAANTKGKLYVDNNVFDKLHIMKQGDFFSYKNEIYHKNRQEIVRKP